MGKGGGGAASDAFFPLADGLSAAVEAGVTALTQPGGSIRDDDGITGADEGGLAMVVRGCGQLNYRDSSRLPRRRKKMISAGPEARNISLKNAGPAIVPSYR